MAKRIQTRLSATAVRGRVSIFHLLDGQRSLLLRRHNVVVYDWGAIMARLLADGNSSYRLNGMYIEYGNVDPADPVSVVAPTRDNPADYFAALEADPTRDYFRVPMIAATRSSTDITIYPNDNSVTFFAMADGTLGTLGRTYTSGPSEVSKICGAALAATPSLTDPTQDLFFSRIILAEGDQIAKPEAGQIGIQWDIQML